MTRFQGKYRIETSRLKFWNYGWNAIYLVTLVTRNREEYFGKISGKKLFLNDLGKAARRFWKEVPLHFPFIVLDEFIIMPNHIHGILIFNKKEDGKKDFLKGIRERSVYRNDNTPKAVETQNFASQRPSKMDSDHLTPPVETENLPSQRRDSNQAKSFPYSHLFLDNQNKKYRINELVNAWLRRKILRLNQAQSDNEGSVKDPSDNFSLNTFGPQSQNLGAVIRGFKIGVTKFAKLSNITFAWQPGYWDHLIRNFEEYKKIKYYIRYNPRNWEKDELH